MASPQIDYVEFASTDLAASKQFFSTVFGWRFTDYGAQYSAFARAEAGLDGGFHPAESVQAGGPLVVLRSAALEQTQAAIEAAGGVIVEPIFAFPGGRRFHFREPGGNVLAVWSDS